MDLETENRLAALLMEEARQLRLQAEREGVHAYLRKPNVRTRPNSRFLTATVLGVQQSNRVVEVREMWHAREKELEIEAKQHNRSKEERYSERNKKYHGGSSSSHSRRQRDAGDSAISCSSNKQGPEDHYSSEDGSLRDDEVENFLQSRAKRGRGSIGSRMDEPGPYPSSVSSGRGGVHPEKRLKKEAERCTLGPEKPSFLRYGETHKGDSSGYFSGDDTCGARKHHSKGKHRKKDKSDKAKRKEHKSKHRSRKRD